MEPMTVRGLDAGGTFDKPADANGLSAVLARIKRKKAMQSVVGQIAWPFFFFGFSFIATAYRSYSHP